MWPFASRSLRERFDDLESAHKQLKGDFKRLETEWEGVYEKYRVAMSKLARRDIRERETPLPDAQDAPRSTNVHPVKSDYELLHGLFGGPR